MILKIKIYPDKILKTKAKPVGLIDDAIKKLVDDMVETMYAGQGVGLAANQVGAAQQIITVDAGDGLINPKIISKKGKQISAEGCLSFPGMDFEGIKRPQAIEVEYKDRRGEQRSLKAQDLLARAICHETDHLKGKTVLDRASLLKRRKYRRQLEK